MFDLVCILIMAAAVVLGGRRGFMAQTGAFIGIIAGIIVCRVFGDDLAGTFTSPADTAGTRMLHTVLAYVVLFGVCYLGGRLIGSALRGTIKVLHLGWVDRIAGAVLKLCEYLLIFSILLNLWMALFPDTQLNSRREGLTDFVVEFAPVVLDSEFAEEIVSGTESLNASLEELKTRHDDTEWPAEETIEP